MAEHHGHVGARAPGRGGAHRRARTPLHRPRDVRRRARRGARDRARAARARARVAARLATPPALRQSPNGSRIRFRPHCHARISRRLRCATLAATVTRVSVTVCDVGPRDGLQNEPDVLPAATRAELVNRIAAAAVPRIEAASFVRAERVPQMADAEDVAAAIARRTGTEYAGLVLNRK